jgi:hypothetical protein
VPGKNKGNIPIKWLKSQSNHYISRFEVEDRSRLVRILPQTGGYERVENEEKEKKWAGQDLNSRSPPCQGGILTRLDHRPYVQ